MRDSPCDAAANAQDLCLRGDSAHEARDARGGKIVFFPGTYVVDSWMERPAINANGDHVRRYGILVPHSQSEIVFEGIGYTHKDVNTSLRMNGKGAVFALSKRLWEAMEENGHYSLLDAGPTEKDGQMYVLWSAEMSPEFSHYELYRDGKFLANVTNEVYAGIPYRVARYEDLGLPTHSRHEYRIRKVWKDGRKDELGEPFFGLTRYVNEEECNGVVCEGENGRMYVRYDGATVISWKPAILQGGEVFFAPENAPWGKEVHGGLPICWPWFGKRDGLPKHGLARYLKWRFVKRIGKDCVVLETASTPETMKVWPHRFKLTAKVSVEGSKGLKVALTETNTGKEPFESACGFHPYFRVTDAERVAVDGERQPPPSVLIQSSVAEKGRCRMLTDLMTGRKIAVECADNEKWFVWNPGVERTPLCETLGPDEWKRFYCIEPFTEKPRPLAPGESRAHEMIIKVCGVDAEAESMRTHPAKPL